MKVYIVKAPQGEYEDYCEPIVKVFADKAKAEEYVKVENDKLPLEQAKRCREYCWTKVCSKEQTCFNPDEYDNCKNYMKYCDIIPLFMEEYEVEE